MRRAGMFWGVVLLVLGGLLLAENLGLLPVSAGALLLPLFLVLLGAWIVVGALGRRGRWDAQAVVVPLSGAPSARVVFSHGAGRLRVGGGAGGGELVAGTFAGGLDHRESRTAEGVVADLRVPSDWTRWGWGPGGSFDWDVRLSEEVPLALELRVGASENILDLSRLRVTEFSLETGASSTDVLLPAAAGLTRVVVRSGAASVRLRVPDGVAACVTGSGGLASFDVDARRFPRAGAAWESPDFARASNRVEIRAEVGVGSVEVR